MFISPLICLVFIRLFCNISVSRKVPHFNDTTDNYAKRQKLRQGQKPKMQTVKETTSQKHLKQKIVQKQVI